MLLNDRLNDEYISVFCGQDRFVTFILTIIGLSLSAKKRKGGMGMALGVGLALSFGYIMLQTVSATFAIQANFPPMLAAWMPNILFAVVAYFCYRNAPR